MKRFVSCSSSGRSRTMRFLTLFIGTAAALQLQVARPPVSSSPTLKHHVSPLQPRQIAAALVLMPVASCRADLWDSLLNDPPITLSPFTINPAGYAFLALYASYLLWQTFGPVSEAEKAWGDKQRTLAAEARAAAPAFLAEAAAAEGAREMPSGLVYQELVAGTGDFPTAEDTVTVSYHGTLADGSVFDSSIDRGQPAEFKREPPHQIDHAHSLAR